MTSNNKFLEDLFTYYDQHGRHNLPWRKTDEPYAIMVSEIMLQQTQVNRVIPKYEAFLAQFPDAQKLAAAELSEVLLLWSGLGYNRRAKYLHQAAKQIVSLGYFPRELTELVALPGIGKNTAGAIITYAHNKPIIFVETNIRTCIIHAFFNNQSSVTDKQIEDILRELLPRVDSPRDFYWAMMDYGAYLKKQGNNISKSKHYTKQSPFEGSKRQIRGRVLRLLGEKPTKFVDLQQLINDERLKSVLDDLQNEQLIRLKDDHYSLG